MVIIIFLIILICIIGLIIYLVIRKNDNSKDLQLQSQILAQQAEIENIKNQKLIIQKVPVYTGWGGGGGWGGWGGRGWGWRRGPWRWRR